MIQYTQGLLIILEEVLTTTTILILIVIVATIQITELVGILEHLLISKKKNILCI